MTDFYRCPECGYIFPEHRAVVEYTSYEAYYSVPVPGHHSLTLYRCPKCDCEDLEEFHPETQEEADDLGSI